MLPQPLRHAGYPVALGTRPGATAAGRSYTVQPRSHSREDRTALTHQLRWGSQSTLTKPCGRPSCRHSDTTPPKKQSTEAGQTMQPAQLQGQIPGHCITKSHVRAPRRHTRPVSPTQAAACQKAQI